MLRSLALLLRRYRQNESDTDSQISGSSSEDDDEIESSMNIGGIGQSPPIITWKHVWPMSETHEALSNSLFGNLPTEILLYTFRLLSVHDLGNISLVCRHFKILADQDDIWKSKCNPSNQIQSKPFKQIYMDWIYGKYLRGRELRKVDDKYRTTRRHLPCLLKTSCCSSEDFLRAKEKINALSIADSTGHPNLSSDITIELSVDIDKTVIALIALLEKTSRFITNWWHPSTTQQMITRYYRFMQLKALYSNQRLIPTLDIEMIWQSHLLRPEMYRGDCLRLFGRIIDHSLLIDANEEKLKEQAFINTCRLYEEHFGEQYCPDVVHNEEDNIYSPYRRSLLNYIECPIPPYSYWDDTLYKFTSTSSNDYKNPFSFVEDDVLLDSYWFELYCTDMYEVGLKIMAYNSQAQPNALLSVMKRLRKSYERFLYMVAKYSTMNENDYIHPTYAIDIVWHSHMQEPLKYVQDCNRLIGFVMNHVPWLSTKTSDQVRESYEKIRDIWKTEFNRDMETDHYE